MLNLKKFNKVGYDIFSGNISNLANKNLFKNLVDFCKFYCPSIFNQNYKKFWSDEKFNHQLISLRKKDKKVFAAIYNSFARSSALYNFCYSNNLHKLAANILGVNEKHIGIRDPIMRMDVPKDKRNIYGWHQDSAYSKLHKDPKNEVVFWIPLINTNKKNGAIVVKPNSHNIIGDVSYLKNKGGKFTSKQYVIQKKYLDKFKSKSIKVKANSVLAAHGNLFHKSGYNISNQIRFTIIVRFYKILVTDYIHYRDNQKNLTRLKKFYNHKHI